VERGPDGGDIVVPDKSAIGAKVLPGRNETYAFVKAKSENDSDYLSGMCFFVERWLQHVGVLRSERS